MIGPAAGHRSPRRAVLAVFVLSALAAGCVDIPDQFAIVQGSSRPPTATATFATVPPTATATATETPTPTATPSTTPTATPDFSDLATPVPGTSVLFDLDTDLSDPNFFYDLPYPSDVRLGLDGRPDLSGFPFPPNSDLVAAIHSIAADRFGFATLPAAYFRFTAPVRPQHIDDVIPPSVGAAIMLIDVDPRSPERGRLFPVVATTLEADAYVPQWVIAIGSVPGILLAPERTYAFVIKRALRDAEGRPLGVPATFAQLRSGAEPSGRRGAAARDLYRALWDTLDDLDVPRADIAAATVFTTGDAVADLATLSNRVLERYDVAIEDLELVSVNGTQPPRFCELAGSVSMPQFQRGVPPFDTDGLFVFDSSGTPILQREEKVPMVLTLPRSPMPAGGYPVALYLHGDTGRSTEVVDRGPTRSAGEEPIPGEGPAYVLAARGLAAVGSALPLNPERFASGEERPYLNLNNPAAYRDTLRQGAIEQRLLIEAIGRVRIDPALLADCPGPQPAGEETALSFRPESVAVFGQSLGAQYANMVGAIDPRVGAVVASGSGGMWSLLLLQVELFPGADPQAVTRTLLQTSAALTFLHPGLQLIESAWEAADPIAFAPRIARRPLAGHPARSIYQPVGEADPNFPQAVYDAMALAHGNQQAGDIIWLSMQTALTVDNLDGLPPYPVAHNQASADGRPYTGVAAQYTGDGILTSHDIAFQLDGVKFQYACFLASLARTGIATVPATQALDSACP